MQSDETLLVRNFDQTSHHRTYPPFGDEPRDADVIAWHASVQTTSAPGVPDLAGFATGLRLLTPVVRDLDFGNGRVVKGHALRAITSRSGGPGGQHVNKVETRVTIELDVDALPLEPEDKLKIRERLRGRINRSGVLRVTSQAARSQIANRDRALDRMEELLREALEDAALRKSTKVSNAQKQRRLDDKKRRAETKRLRSTIE